MEEFILYSLPQEQITINLVPLVETQRSKFTYLDIWNKLKLIVFLRNRSKTWKCFRRLLFRKKTRCTCLVRERTQKHLREPKTIWMKAAPEESKAYRELCKMRDTRPKCTSSNSHFKTASTNKTAAWCEWAVTTLLSCRAKLALPSNQACRATDSTINKVSLQ